MSCKDTTRVAPLGVSPERRRRVWAATCSTTAARRSSSATVAFAFPLAASPAWRRPRRALRATALASAAAASAITAISPVMAYTSLLASSLRRRSHAPMSCARRRIDRVRSRVLVRVANPMPRSCLAKRAMAATPLASKLESVG